MDNPGMITYKRHRFPPAIISSAVWLYYRFNLSHRDIEDLLAQRGIAVSYEAIRLWCAKFGPELTKRLRRIHQGYGDTLHIDEELEDKLHRQIAGHRIRMTLSVRHCGKFCITFRTKTKLHDRLPGTVKRVDALV